MEYSPYALKKGAEDTLPKPELLWPEGLPGIPADTPSNRWVNRSETHLDRGCSIIFRPELYAFLPEKEKRNGQAIIVCPGGGYTGTAFDKEGCDVARLLNANGICAFVLNYRDAAGPDGSFGFWPEGPLSDALRAIRTVRRRAETLGINPGKIGIMGFSSGGHLALTASTLYADVKEDDPEWAAVSARPDMTVAIYPVCSFISEKQHRGSVLRLLGTAGIDQLIRFSPERNVTSETPPAFLLHAADDAAVPVDNSIFYFQALRAKGIDAECHIFQNGGHGFGMNRHGMTKDGWETLLISWLAAHA